MPSGAEEQLLYGPLAFYCAGTSGTNWSPPPYPGGHGADLDELGTEKPTSIAGAA